MYKENDGFDSTKNDGALTCIMDEGVSYKVHFREHLRLIY